MTLTQIFAKVLNMSLTASLVIVLVIAARFILRKSPKVFSYALWAVVLFRLLCPVSLPSPVSLLGLLDAPVAESDGITSSVEYVPTNAGGYREIIVQNPVRTEIPDVPVPQQNQQVDVPSPAKSVSVAEIITYVWIAGMAVLFLVGIGSYFRFRRHLTGACQLKGNIYLVDHIDSAFVAGLFSPKIYLPSDLPVKQMRYIIAHEQYHLRRFDHIAKHLAFAALCIHWFNPMVWAAFILSGKDMEMSCDEAVIKKLGEGIRADYSASLLTLAMGHRIIAGSPLAFGEGDTKGRIKNMAKWKQPKKWVSVLSWIVCLAVLTACAANPEKEVVTSKNDGSFDANVVQSATKPAEGQDTPAGQRVQYTDSFSSTDGSVEFTLNIDTEVSNAPMPVAEVEPHYLTGQDAKRVAEVLFGDAEIYEARPILAPKETIYSKSQVQELLTKWAQYTDLEFLLDLYGDERNAETTAEVVKKFIADYSEAYDNFQEEDPRVPCEWTLKPDAYYLYSPDEVAQMDVSDYNYGIEAEVTANGIGYIYTVSTRNKVDFKINNIIVRLGDGGISPDTIDIRTYEARLCRTDKPTDAQMEAAQAKASELLAQMELGDWLVDECYLQTINYYGDTPEYVICVNAVPVINGIPASRRPQLDNLRSKEVYSSNYYLTDASFGFSADGRLVSFQLYSSIDVTEILNDNVATLGIDELMEKAKSHLSLSDRASYGNAESALESYEETFGEPVVCRIDVTELKYGLTRVKAPNTDDSYYYVPALLLSGSVAYCGKDTGTVYETNEQFTGKPTWALVCLNAVDGSVIELQNPSPT